MYTTPARHQRHISEQTLFKSRHVWYKNTYLQEYVPIWTEPVPIRTEPVLIRTEPVPIWTEPVPIWTEPAPNRTEPVLIRTLALIKKNYQIFYTWTMCASQSLFGRPGRNRR